MSEQGPGPGFVPEPSYHPSVEKIMETSGDNIGRITDPNIAYDVAEAGSTGGKNLIGDTVPLYDESKGNQALQEIVMKTAISDNDVLAQAITDEALGYSNPDRIAQAVHASVQDASAAANSLMDLKMDAVKKAPLKEGEVRPKTLAEMIGEE